MNRMKKPGFLKVFEAQGQNEKDHCRLLDIEDESLFGDMGAGSNQFAETTFDTSIKELTASTPNLNMSISSLQSPVEKKKRIIFGKESKVMSILGGKKDNTQDDKPRIAELEQKPSVAPPSENHSNSDSNSSEHNSRKKGATAILSKGDGLVSQIEGRCHSSFVQIALEDDAPRKQRLSDSPSPRKEGKRDTDKRRKESNTDRNGRPESNRRNMLSSHHQLHQRQGSRREIYRTNSVTKKERSPTTRSASERNLLRHDIPDPRREGPPITKRRSPVRRGARPGLSRSTSERSFLQRKGDKLSVGDLDEDKIVSPRPRRDPRDGRARSRPREGRDRARRNDKRHERREHRRDTDKSGNHERETRSPHHRRGKSKGRRSESLARTTSNEKLDANMRNRTRKHEHTPSCKNNKIERPRKEDQALCSNPELSPLTATKAKSIQNGEPSISDHAEATLQGGAKRKVIHGKEPGECTEKNSDTGIVKKSDHCTSEDEIVFTWKRTLSANRPPIKIPEGGSPESQQRRHSLLTSLPLAVSRDRRRASLAGPPSRTLAPGEDSHGSDHLSPSKRAPFTFEDSIGKLEQTLQSISPLIDDYSKEATGDLQYGSRFRNKQGGYHMSPSEPSVCIDQSRHSRCFKSVLAEIPFMSLTGEKSIFDLGYKLDREEDDCHNATEANHVHEYSRLFSELADSKYLLHEAELQVKRLERKTTAIQEKIDCLQRENPTLGVAPSSPLSTTGN